MPALTKADFYCISSSWMPLQCSEVCACVGGGAIRNDDGPTGSERHGAVTGETLELGTLTGPELLLQNWPPAPGLETWKRPWKRDSCLLSIKSLHTGAQRSPLERDSLCHWCSVSADGQELPSKASKAPALAPGKEPGWRAMDK